jgi:hypothetical protein
MSARRDKGHTWEDEPIGVVYSEKRRRFSHRWTEFLLLPLGFAGMVLVIGAAKPFDPVLMGASVAVLAGVAALSRSDLAHRQSVRLELVWLAAAVVLLVGGGTVWAVAS